MQRRHWGHAQDAETEEGSLTRFGMTGYFCFAVGGSRAAAERVVAQMQGSTGGGWAPALPNAIELRRGWDGCFLRW